jgi:hypothetical protein
MKKLIKKLALKTMNVAGWSKKSPSGQYPGETVAHLLIMTLKVGKNLIVEWRENKSFKMIGNLLGNKEVIGIATKKDSQIHEAHGYLCLVIAIGFLAVPTLEVIPGWSFVPFLSYSVGALFLLKSAVAIHSAIIVDGMLSKQEEEGGYARI